jgi:hypothetical protein
VVSTETRSRLLGFTAPDVTAASTVTDNSSSMPVAPMCSRQRVSELGSIGSWCCK